MKKTGETMKKRFELKMNKQNPRLIDKVTAKRLTIDGFLQKLLKEYKEHQSK